MFADDNETPSVDELLADMRARETVLIDLKNATLIDALTAIAALPPEIAGRARQRLGTMARGIFREDSHTTTDRPDEDSGRHEYKAFRLYHHGNAKRLTLLTTVGQCNDEGTYAEIFARNTRHIALNPRGGVVLMNPARWVKKGDKCRKVRVRSRVRGLFNAIHHTTD